MGSSPRCSSIIRDLQESNQRPRAYVDRCFSTRPLGPSSLDWSTTKIFYIYSQGFCMIPTFPMARPPASVRIDSKQNNTPVCSLWTNQHKNTLLFLGQNIKGTVPNTYCTNRPRFYIRTMRPEWSHHYDYYNVHVLCVIPWTRKLSSIILHFAKTSKINTCLLATIDLSSHLLKTRE